MPIYYSPEREGWMFDQINDAEHDALLRLAEKAWQSMVGHAILEDMNAKQAEGGIQYDA